jgi:hypothetical protein
VEVLRVGRFRDLHGREIAVDAALLGELADSYDPSLYQAPVVIGHPQHNSPAFGLLAEPRASATGLTVALTDLDAAFVAAHRAKRYPQRSLSFWPAGHPDNPLPDQGRAYLRHLGFLGGVAPAVKGLRGADLAAADAGVVTLDLAELSAGEPGGASPEPIDETSEQTMTDTTPADSAADSTAAAQAAELAERESALETRAAALAAREQALAQAEAARRREQVTAFAEGLANQARLRPADVPRVVEILLALDEARPEPVPAFAEAGEAAPAQTPGQWLRARLAEREPLVALGEVASAARAGAETPPAAFSTPDGFGVAPEALATYRRAKAYQAEHPACDFVGALRAVNP